MVAAGFLGFEAIQLVRGGPPKSGLDVPQTPQDFPGTGLNPSYTPPAGNFSPLPQYGLPGTNITPDDAINQAVNRALQNGRITPSDVSAWTRGLERILQFENAGGNPCAYYKHPDAACGAQTQQNVEQGNLAAGLFQVKPQTFAGVLPGGNIWNPVDNVYAAILHILGVWGDPSQIPGLYPGTGVYQGY